MPAPPRSTAAPKAKAARDAGDALDGLSAGARRAARPVGDRRDLLPRRVLVDARRVLRRRGVLRRVRLPHHVAVARRAGSHRRHQARSVLATPRLGACCRLCSPSSPRSRCGRSSPPPTSSSRSCGRDLPWAIFYGGNWGQIVGGVPYYSGDPPLLRHVWSLAVEEQWYLFWPLAFVALRRTRLSAVRHRRVARGDLGGVMAWTYVAPRQRARQPRVADRRARWRRPHQLHVPVDRHPGVRTRPRCGCGVRVATVAIAGGGPIQGRLAARRRRPARRGDARVHRRGRRRSPTATCTSGCSPSSPCCRSSPCSSPCTRRRRGSGRYSRGLRSSRSASAATASTCGTGRSSCSPTPTAAPCRGSSPPWRSRRWSRSCATASSRCRCAVASSVDGGDRQASGALVPLVVTAAAVLGHRRLLRLGRSVRPRRWGRRRHVRGDRRRSRTSRRRPSPAPCRATTVPRIGSPIGRRRRRLASPRPGHQPSRRDR